jgi:5-methylcytosine-specific restriction endonuclease McrA
MKFPKSRPAILDRQARKRDESTYLKEQRKLALLRDQLHCRVCGGMLFLECHHVEPRSHSGPKRKVEAHHQSNLLTLCRECHGMVTGNLLKVIPTTDRGADGPVQVLKYSESQRTYIVFKKAA